MSVRRLDICAAPHESHYFGTGGRVTQLATRRHRDCSARHLTHAARGDALMCTIENHEHSPGNQGGVESRGNLFSESLLKLGSRRKGLHHARNATEADEGRAGQVGHISLTHKRK